MNNPTAALKRLNEDRPEWRPWLVVLDELLSEATEPRWDDCVPVFSECRAHVPRLAKASIAIPRDLLRRWIMRLLRAAAAGGTAPLATLRPLVETAPLVELFRAALCQDDRSLDEIAARQGADAAALRGVAALLPMPLLHACSRRLDGAASEDWRDGYCPLCGAWPAFAEVRGIERARYLRCARCGAEWAIHWLYCPFCGAAEHQQLVSLRPENGSGSRSVEACNGCGGYVKSFTVLQAPEALGVFFDDLASIDLDIAAIEQGYHRSDGSGYPLNVQIGEERSFRSRFFYRER